jgi:sugar transferase EpsL
MRSIIERATAGALLVVCAPILAVLAAVVRWRLGGPVLFTQERLGQGEMPFRLRKFRTMTEDRDAATGTLQPDDERLTPFGRRLRATSLDELPELWNIVAGDMAFVGPRPLPVAYRDRFTSEEHRRHEVRPGITGWAQVHGRNCLDWDERLALDVWYVDHRSLRLDLRILGRTVGAVLRRDGIAGSGTATMAELPAGRADV